MSCKEHDPRSVNPVTIDGVEIVGGPPQSQEEPAWCRWCGALWSKRPFDLGWGWRHRASDRTAPTLFNEIFKDLERNRKNES